jgi:HD superfamily phosphohydrolase YqeK
MTDAATIGDLAALHRWFTSYCASFRSSAAEVQRNYDLKELHTRNVCQAASLITEGGDAGRRMLAEVAGLCHDLGRFPQYRDHRTFRDAESVNHAELSARVLQQTGVLEFLPAPERESVILAVRFHNLFEIPTGLPPETEDLLKVVRDADKLDIWRVFADYFRTPESERASAAALGCPDLPHCSPDVLETVASGKMVQLSALKSLNDFKLLQVSWVYDINFLSTLRLIKERHVLEQMAAMLPEEEAVLHVFGEVKKYLDRRLASGRDDAYIAAGTENLVKGAR